MELSQKVFEKAEKVLSQIYDSTFSKESDDQLRFLGQRAVLVADGFDLVFSKM